jgi:hypothetical protein
MCSKLCFSLFLTAALLTGSTAVEAELYRSVRRPVVANCAANQRPIVRRVRVNGRTTERVACVSRVASARVVRRAPAHRSWKKTALVIGGSTAAGAGAGALIGGKKGALIGGAIGGAAGTVYEVHKRHKLRRHRVRR